MIGLDPGSSLFVSLRLRKIKLISSGREEHGVCTCSLGFFPQLNVGYGLGEKGYEGVE